MGVPAHERPRALELGGQGLTIDTAVDHLVDAAQGVVRDQFELARLDLEVVVSRILRGAALVIVGVLFLAGAGVALAIAGYAMLPDSYPPEQRLAIIAGVSAVVGVALATLGAYRMRAHVGH